MAVITQIQFRRGTASQWSSTNPTLAAGELGYETDTGNFKIGNGSTAWNSLSVLNGITASTTATFTNKTFDTAGAGNVFRINGTQITAVTGSGSAVLATSPTLTTPILGTPQSVTLTNGTGLPVSTGISGLGTGVATFLATPSSANLAAALTDETGTGAAVFATSPTLTTPNIGVATGTSFNSITGLSSTNPAALGTVAVGTGTTTARADHVHPTTGLGLTASGLNQFAATTSAQLAGVISDETGSGALVFGTSPTLGGTVTASGQINMTATNAFGNLQDYQTLDLMGCL